MEWNELWLFGHSAHYGIDMKFDRKSIFILNYDDAHTHIKQNSSLCQSIRFNKIDDRFKCKSLTFWWEIYIYHRHLRKSLVPIESNKWSMRHTLSSTKTSEGKNRWYSFDFIFVTLDLSTVFRHFTEALG